MEAESMGRSLIINPQADNPNDNQFNNNHSSLNQENNLLVKQIQDTIQEISRTIYRS